jgi:hypothetical protein
MPISAQDDFLVNSTIVGNQYRGAMTELADGRLVVTFESAGTVRGRIFNPDGSPAGADFEIDSTSGDGLVADVVALPD